MTEALSLARRILLEPYGLEFSHLDQVLGRILTTPVDLADIYLQFSRFESWVLEDGIVKEGAHSLEQGFGVRAVCGDKTGFAYSDVIEFAALMEAASKARAIARHATSAREAIAASASPRQLYPYVDPLQSLSAEDKVDLLCRLDKIARQSDPRVEQVIVSLAGSFEVILIVTQDGALQADVRPLVRLNVNVIMTHRGRREQGSAGGGGRTDYQFFLENQRAEGYVAEAVHQAQVNLEAAPAPAGTLTVVLGSGWPGVLLHEAIGHGLEGDFNRKGTSAFSGRIGEKVASSLCTVVDDGTLPGQRGSLNLDDEGTPTQRTVLIEGGILKNYMQDRMNAHLMGTLSTGNGRRESYAYPPLPRMTNTYLLPGEYSPEEIIASVDKGLYAKNFGGGQVDITSGKFVFSACEAYWIENGRIAYPVKGATLIGNGPEVLTRVSMVGNDLCLDPGVGTCGKEGQSVPVGVGQPTLRVDGLTVGGTLT
ncbi:MAG: metalloprotease TldD [Methylohalobius sp.]|nr:metalloprotease TldD [Methylohalobius sp.]